MIKIFVTVLLFSLSTCSGLTIDNSDSVQESAQGVLNENFLFNIGDGFNGSVDALAIDSQNRIYAAGNFDEFNGTSVGRIVRLSAAGIYDSSFVTGNGFNDRVRALAIDSDGALLVGGDFTLYGNVSVDRLVRLDEAGGLDLSFATRIGDGFSDSVRIIAVQTDGKILVGGDFQNFGLFAVDGIARLQSTGTEDSVFNTKFTSGANASVYSIAGAGESLYLVGSFTSVAGISSVRAVKMDTSGNVDSLFSSNLGTGFNGTVYSMISFASELLFVGSFSSFKSEEVGAVALAGTSASALSATHGLFGEGFNDQVTQVFSDFNSNLNFVGEFSSYDGQSAPGILRLLNDEFLSVDADFLENIGAGPNERIRAVAMFTTGAMLFAGDFTEFNGESAGRIALIE